MSKFILPFFILLAIVSCNKENYKSTHHLSMADSTLNIYIGKQVNPVTRNMSYLEMDDKQLIAYTNMYDLIFYDINKGSMFHKIKFHAKGPNGIGNLDRFHIESLNSIFIFTYTHLSISDSSGHVYKRKEFAKVFKDLPIAPMPSFYDYNNRVIKSQNQLDIACYLMDENFSDIENLPTGLIYDIQKDSFCLNKQNFPPLDDSDVYSRDKDKTSYVYSFSLQNKIHRISENGQFEAFPCKSKFAAQKLTPVAPSQDLQAQIIATIKNPSYYSLVYDKWKNVFYRFFYPGNKDIDAEKELDYYWAQMDNPEQFSVMILNDDLKVIGETLIPKNTCNPYMYFINKNGLHFALHVKNPDFDPDYLKFARFSVEKINNPNQ